MPANIDRGDDSPQLDSQTRHVTKTMSSGSEMHSGRVGKRRPQVNMPRPIAL